MQGFKMVARYSGRSRYVRFVPDAKLTRACDLAGDDPRIVFRVLDHPPGHYCVTSLSHPGYAYIVRLDPESGRLLTHRCERLTNNPDAFCAHFVKAYLLWMEEQEQALDNGEWEEIDMDQSTALALAGQEETQLIPAPSLPTREEWTALGRLAIQLFEHGRGDLIPNDVKTWQHLAGLMLYGREMGFDPMTSLKVTFMIGGRYELNSHGKRAMVQRAGGDIQYEYGEDSVTAILMRPGRPETKVTYTLAQASKTPEYNRNPNWKSRPEDMLVAAATNRACRRGASDVINAIDWASRRAPSVLDMPTISEESEEHTERQALPVIDEETGEIHDATFTNEEEPPSPAEDESPTASADTPSENTTSEGPGPEASDSGMDGQQETPGPAISADAPSTSASDTQEKSPAAVDGSPTTSSTTDPKAMTYRQAKAKPADNIPVLSRFQKAIRGKGDLPSGHQDMTLDAIVTAMGGSWPE